jgi:hypothetical protein
VSIDAKIDDLYRQPLDTFVTARNALAKTLSGPDATRVRALAKPTIVPWAVNQVYWRARPTYDKVFKSGERLRAAQIASLEGRRGADVREAGEAHRRALAEAVKEAERLATEAGSNPAADAIMRTFEALSLASGSPEPPGRLTKPLQPAGFEALAGVTPVLREGVTPEARGAASSGHGIRLQPDREPSKLDRRKELAAAEAARRHAAAMKQAEAALARAEAAEHRAREAWDGAHDELLKARQDVTRLKSTKSEV